MAIVKDNVDFNSVESGIINYSYATGILNAPHEGSYGILFSIKRENGQIWQMCRDFSNGYLYQRHRNADGWLPWRITYDTSLLTNNGLLGELANALGVLNIKSALNVTSQMNQAWVDGMEASFQQTTGAQSWFQGYNSAAQECAWFGYRTYQNWATVICIVGYNNEANMLCKGCRDNEGNWKFYRFVGGL